jgi:hypothetical protein
MRFGINEKDIHHAPEYRILELAEQLVPGDKMAVEREISGYHITVNESTPPNPPRDFEG